MGNQQPSSKFCKLLIVYKSSSKNKSLEEYQLTIDYLNSINTLHLQNMNAVQRLDGSG